MPLFIGEWGVQTADTGAAAFQSQMLDLFQRYGLSWARFDIGKGDSFTLLNDDGSWNAMGQSLKQALATPAPTTGIRPAADIKPALSGFAQASQTLTVDQGLWSGVPAPAVTYAWNRCNSSGANCTAIAGAAGPAYTLTQADLGFKIKASVTAANSAGSTTAMTAGSAVVSPLKLTIANLTAVTSPVSPAITIRWSQNLAATVSVTITSSSGAVVKHLLRSGWFDPGAWVKRWGRLNDGGGTAGAGTYTVTVAASGNGETASVSTPVVL